MDDLMIVPLHEIGDNLTELAEDSVREGHRHIRRLIDDYGTGTNRFDRPGEILLGAVLGGKIVGVCGLNRDPYSHNPRVGRVRRVYVRPGYRRNRVGHRLMAAIIEEAKQHYTLLTLFTESPEADRFYRSLGFHAEPGEGNVSHRLELHGIKS